MKMGTLRGQVEEDAVKCVGGDGVKYVLQDLMDNLSEGQLVAHESDIHHKAVDIDLKEELADSFGTVNLQKVKELSLDDSSNVSHFEGTMLQASKGDSGKHSTAKDLNNVPGLQHNSATVKGVGECRAEYCSPALDLPSLVSILSVFKNSEGFTGDKCSDLPRFQETLSRQHKVDPHLDLCFVLKDSKELPAYLLAEVVMNMSTVAVFLTQHASFPADSKRDDASAYAVPTEANGPSYAGNKGADMSQEAAAVKANTYLLASTVVPYIKLLSEQYTSSLGSDLRRALHEAKLMEYRGYGPDPAPDWMPCHVSEMLSRYDYLGYKEDSFNPLFECIWLTWATTAEFYHHQDVAMICDQETLSRGLHYKTLASLCLSCAIPTRPVLEYMVAMAPHGKIAEIGSGLGYWAALLRKLGADIVAVDDFSERSIPSAFYFPETICADGEDFVRQGGAHGRAIFFCWPQKSWNQRFSLGMTCKQMYQTCLAEACLDAFRGDIVFFVGEKDDGCTFDMAAWMQRSPKHRRTWRLEKEIDIPSWPGVHDVFLCFVKHNEEGKHASGKKKKKAARKAHQVEDANFVQLEKAAKEEEFLSASFAAYPNCSMQ